MGMSLTTPLTMARQVNVSLTTLSNESFLTRMFEAPYTTTSLRRKISKEPTVKKGMPLAPIHLKMIVLTS